jgi:hypothetical protein
MKKYASTNQHGWRVMCLCQHAVRRSLAIRRNSSPQLTLLQYGAADTSILGYGWTGNERLFSVLVRLMYFLIELTVAC